MSNIPQITISINADDLGLTTANQKHPLGLIHEVNDNRNNTNINSRYIYLRAQASGGDLASFQPYSVIGTGFEGSQARAVLPFEILYPGVQICVPQVIKGGPTNNVVPQDNYAFFLLSGPGQGKINLAGVADNYYVVEAASPTEFQKQTPQGEYRVFTHMGIINAEPTPNVIADIILFNRTGQVLA